MNRSFINEGNGISTNHSIFCTQPSGSQLNIKNIISANEERDVQRGVVVVACFFSCLVNRYSLLHQGK